MTPIDSSSPATATRALERFLAVVAVAVCAIVSVRIYQVVSVSQAMWPLPGLYLLEMLGITAVGALGIWRGEAARSWLSKALAWIAVGALLGFAVLGAWSIGFLYLPMVVLLLIAAILADRRQRQAIGVHVGIGVIAAVVQILLMLAVIRLMYPDAIY